MMRDNSDKRRRRRAPVVCAVVAVAVLGLVLAAVLLPLLDIGSGEGAVIAILVCYALFILAMIVGILAALRQRLREIDSGEEDEAAQY